MGGEKEVSNNPHPFVGKLGYCKVVLVTSCQSAACRSHLLVGCHLPLHLPLLPLSPCWGEVGPSRALAGGVKTNTASFLQARAVCS